MLVSAEDISFKPKDSFLIGIGCQYHAWTWTKRDGLNEGVSSMPTDSYLFKLSALNFFNKKCYLSNEKRALRLVRLYRG